MASSEVAPFAKTGGLADVVGALPKYIYEKGIDVSVVLPLYKKIKDSDFPLRRLSNTLRVFVGEQPMVGNIFTSNLPNSNVTVYFVEMDYYYNRDALYGTALGDYRDNCERFTFFCKVVLELVKELKLKFDIIHCHDWQSALIPIYMRTLYSQYFQGVKSVFTVHNLAYQGLFWHWDMPLTGLDWRYFNWKELEFYGKVNFLKGGLVFADAITTVSKTYAKEIQTEEYGCGLEGVLRERKDNLYGIINGIDYNEWNPEIDKLISHNYNVDTLVNKEKCKLHLQKKIGLPVDANIPLIGIIGRLAEQKGIDIIVDILPRLLNNNIQVVILGTGDIRYHNMLENVWKSYSNKLSLNLTFDNRLAHEIEAGADIFLMPSRFEPCGLNQLYSLRYGTVPVVRTTGGLADTIIDYTDETSNNRTATGFTFNNYNGEALYNAIERALKLYKDKVKWRGLLKNGMKQDWSWSNSAQEYVELYKQLVKPS